MEIEDAVVTIPPPAPLPTQVSAAMHPGELLRMAMANNRDLETINRLMDLQDRWEGTQARKAFNTAMARFRESHIKVTRSAVVKQGPMNGTAYAKLSDFVTAAAGPLADAGLSVSWRITQDAKDWIEVACIVRHVQGHEEETRMGGPPDQSGAKNAIQARASTVSYLEKYTLKMALGLAEQDDDDDGNGGPENAGQSRAQSKAEPTTKPSCPADYFEKNLPDWQKLVSEGREPSRIIAKVETKYTLSDEQKNQIRGKEATQ